MSNLLITNSLLMSQWDFDKNEEIDVNKITLGSNKKVWWKCDNGHKWKSSVKSRTYGSDCPFCSNRKVLPGYNDLATVNPQLASEWNYEKNEELTPTQVIFKADKKVWWKCSEGHEWKATVGNRNNGSGCPYCSNYSVLTGYNDLVTTNPKLADEWNYERNGELQPTDVTSGSHKKVWWICQKGHEWIAEVKSRNSGENCPYCSNKKLLQGYNDLATTNPQLSAEWNYEKNGGLTPSSVIAGTSKKVWWKCQKGHEWEASIDSRNSGRSCPFCSNNRILEGHNDLLTTHPEIAEQWDYKKNKKSPSEVMAGSNNKKYWFICPKGHSYQATLLSRKNGTNCPICAMERHTSFPEKAIFYYIKKHFIGAEENYHNSFLRAMEIDVFLPQFKLGVEYDGRAWHKSVKRDIVKDDVCAKNGITLIRIREKGCQDYHSGSIKKYIEPYDMKKLNAAILYVFSVINEKFNLSSKADVDVERDRADILKLMNMSEKENSIANYRPEIKDFWDYEKNGLISPEQISHGSFKKIYLKCKLGHEWETTASVFDSRPYCPYCSGRKVWAGFNDLFTTNPELKPFWSKKNSVDPTKIGKGCNSKVLWYCSICNGEYEMKVSDKTRGFGCPYCSGYRVLKGYNDLETAHPELLKEWDYEKNNPLKPDEVTVFSNKKVWWKCQVCGYEWHSSIVVRTGKTKRGCPSCSKRNRMIPNAKIVQQFTMDGVLISEYVSATEAMRQTGIKHISSACRYERGSAGGYIWRYKEQS